MSNVRDQIRDLEGQLLRGELTADQFETFRQGVLREDAEGATQTLPTPPEEDFGDELEIIAGPAEDDADSGPPPTTESSGARGPDPTAFDDEEPTDPQLARRREEIEDMTLSMVLDTQGEIVIDRDLMLADALDELRDEEEAPALKIESPPSMQKIYSFIDDASGLLRGMLILAAGFFILIISIAGMISTMGADGFTCMVSKRVNTVGVWKTYYENFPVGECSEQAKGVVRAAGLMAPSLEHSPRDAVVAEQGDEHSHKAHHGTDHSHTTGTGAHPLEAMETEPSLRGVAKITDHPDDAEMAMVYPVGLKSEPTPTEQADTERSPEETADSRYCVAAKKVNSLDGWRDYLEHFPAGGCVERANHFISTRAPSASSNQVLEQRATSRGPSDFLIDTIVLNDAAVRRCVRVERGRGRNVPQTMGIHFTIHAEGRVSGARLVDQELAGTSLDQCISEQVNFLRFPAWNGRNRTITYTMDLQRHATLPKRRRKPVHEEPHEHEEPEHAEEEHEEAKPGLELGGGGAH